ncbi:MAG: hypothetical protein LBO66_12800 [Deltaproteobacteria bacterium]|nr:hypothetical protein [Deltaproteobacteria bacterium]
METTNASPRAKAWGSGVHLILATRKPPARVLTRVIKANPPTRVSFQSATKFASRAILSQTRAETLLRRRRRALPVPRNLQVTTAPRDLRLRREKRRVTVFIRANGPPQLSGALEAPRSQRRKRAAKRRGTKSSARPLRAVRRAGESGVSFIQRRLNIGRDHAANLKEALERAGVIAPQEGLKPPLVYCKNEPERSKSLVFILPRALGAL